MGLAVFEDFNQAANIFENFVGPGILGRCEKMAVRVESRADGPKSSSVCLSMKIRFGLTSESDSYQLLAVRHAIRQLQQTKQATFCASDCPPTSP
jgi:hypothetical protein